VVKQDFCVWVSGQPASVARSIARALELSLAGTGGRVVLAAERSERASASREGFPRLVEVVVGDAPSGAEAPDVTVPGDGARAGESARAVLRHLADAGYSDPLDDYSDDDEAAVSVRLQAFGYL
jgi:hypothetical protein